MVLKDKKRIIEILKLYIEKEKEVTRIFDEEDGIDINAADYSPECEMIMSEIKSFIHYQEARAEHEFIAQQCSELDVDNLTKRQLINEADKKRREAHNSALMSVRGLVSFGERMNLPPIYDGELLTVDQIEHYKSEYADTRDAMTDFFLTELASIRTYSEENNKDEEENVYDEELISTKKSIISAERQGDISYLSDDVVAMKKRYQKLLLKELSITNLEDATDEQQILYEANMDKFICEITNTKYGYDSANICMNAYKIPYREISDLNLDEDSKLEDTSEVCQGEETLHDYHDCHETYHDIDDDFER